MLPFSVPPFKESIRAFLVEDDSRVRFPPVFRVAPPRISTSSKMESGDESVNVPELFIAIAFKDKVPVIEELVPVKTTPERAPFVRVPSTEKVFAMFKLLVVGSVRLAPDVTIKLLKLRLVPLIALPEIEEVEPEMYIDEAEMAEIVPELWVQLPSTFKQLLNVMVPEVLILIFGSLPKKRLVSVTPLTIIGPVPTKLIVPVLPDGVTELMRPEFNEKVLVTSKEP